MFHPTIRSHFTLLPLSDFQFCFILRVLLDLRVNRENRAKEDMKVPPVQLAHPVCLDCLLVMLEFVFVSIYSITFKSPR